MIRTCLLILILTAWAGEVRAQWLRIPECQENWVGMITVSNHVGTDRKYNEEHWGPYWRCQFNERWSNQLGWYQNSFDEDTIYDLVIYMPWRIPTRYFGVIKLGGAAGFGTGYDKEERDRRSQKHPNGRRSGSGLSLIAGGIAATEIKKQVHVGLFFNKSVYALILEVRWK